MIYQSLMIDIWKTKIRTCRDKFKTNIRCLNLREDVVECKSITVISIDTLLFY